MKIFIAIDDKNGMMFNKRRQSQDEKLREFMLSVCGGGKLYMNEYSFKQFKDCDVNSIVVAEDFLAVAKGEYCFVENADISPYLDSVSEVYLCKWNRHYPSDLKFTAKLAGVFKIVSTNDIVGKSHEKITIEKWSRK